MSSRLRSLRSTLALQLNPLLDRVLKIDTDARLERPEGSSHPYQPSGWTVLPEILPRSSVKGDDVLVDFGAGKGRVLIVASRLYRFRRAVGVELDPALAATARGNCRRLRCRNVDVETADATEWPVPDDMTVAYLFNPFPADMLATFLDRIAASIERRPRRVRLVYYNPPPYGLTGWKLLRQRRGGTLCLFENVSRAGTESSSALQDTLRGIPLEVGED